MNEVEPVAVEANIETPVETVAPVVDSEPNIEVPDAPAAPETPEVEVESTPEQEEVKEESVESPEIEPNISEEPKVDETPKHNSQLDDTLINLEPIGEEVEVSDNESALIKGNKYNEILGLNKEDYDKKREEWENSPKTSGDFEKIFGMKKEEFDRLTDDYIKAHGLDESESNNLDKKDEQIFEELESKDDEEVSEDNPFDSMVKFDTKDKAFFKKFENMEEEINEELKDVPVEESKEKIEVSEESKESNSSSKEKETKVEKEFTKEDALKSLEKIKKELNENEDFLVSKEQAETKIEELDEKIKDANKKMKNLDNYIEFSEEEQGEVDLIKEQHDEKNKRC